MTRKFVVIGGSGLIGKRVVANLGSLGHEAVSASPSSGVDTLTGKGLETALEGADAVIDVSNSPSFEDKAVLAFFETSTRNILAAARAQGVGHYVALSVVGTDRLPDSGYFRAKHAQETLIRTGGIPFSIVRATQFFEFISAIVQSGVEGDAVRISTAAFQPIAAEDVAAAVTQIAIGAPQNRIVDVAGPERRPMADIAREFMRAARDKRAIVADAAAGYFGAKLNDSSLTPTGEALMGPTRLSVWLERLAASRG